MNIKINVEHIGDSIIKMELPSVLYIAQTSTYYWAIDDSFGKDDDSLVKILKNLKLMLERWIDAFLEIENSNKIIYLPFEFEDEYVGFLRISPLPKGKIRVEYVLTQDMHGYSIDPSLFRDFNIDINYKVLSHSFDVETSSLVSDILLGIKNIVFLLDE